MGKGLQKSLQTCISKLRKSSSQLQRPSIPHSSTNWLLSACKYPKTPSFAVDHHKSYGQDTAATLTDIDRFLYENFGSLYAGRGHDVDDNRDHNANVFTSESPHPQRSLQRFFMSPGASNSLAEEDSSSASMSDHAVEAVPVSSVAVVRITTDPYDEFRRSMHEMVATRQMDQCQPLDWDFLEELLFCYLNLNEKAAHKFILGAFVDMMVGSSQESEKTPTGQGKNPMTIERRKKVKDL